MNCNILIIEDHKEQAKVLASIAKEINTNITIFYAADENEAYKYILEKEIHVFLVDIILHTNHSADTSGIKLVEKIRQIPKYMFTPVIFITALEDSAMYAYKELKCYEYIEKPFSKQQIMNVLKKAMLFSREKDEERTLFFRKEGIIFPVKASEILYFTFHNRKTKIYKANGQKLEFPYVTVKMVLDETEGIFLQCSRDTLVNRNVIENIDITNGYIKLLGVDKPIEIGITFRKKLMEKYGIC